MTGILAALGALGDVVKITDTEVDGFVGTPATATAGYRLNSDGTIQQNVNGALSSLGNWVIPGASAAQFECFATHISGHAIDSGTLGSWVPLSSNQIWANVVSAGVHDGVFSIQIRRVGTALVLATANITLDAEST